MIGDCRSVANPGYGLVMTLIGRSGRSIRTETTAPLVPNSTPICSSFHRTTPKWSRRGADQVHLAAGDRRGHREHAGVDPVRHHGVLDRGQLVHAVHGDEAGAAAGDPRAHLGQERDDVEHLGLLRGVVDDRPARGQRRRHDQVLGAGVRRRVQVQVRALQLAGLDPDDACRPRRRPRRAGRSRGSGSPGSCCPGCSRRRPRSPPRRTGAAGPARTAPSCGTGGRSRPAAPGWSGWTRRRPASARSRGTRRPRRPPRPVRRPGGRPRSAERCAAPCGRWR